MMRDDLVKEEPCYRLTTKNNEWSEKRHVVMCSLENRVSINPCGSNRFELAGIYRIAFKDREPQNYSWKIVDYFHHQHFPSAVHVDFLTASCK